eukprot:s4003_g6.t1
MAFLDASFSPACSDAVWEIYVDGATSATAAAWSVVVVRSSSTGTSFHGQLSGPVALQPSSAWWIGATTLDNIAAEFTSLLVAMSVVHSGQLDGKSVLRPDLALSRAIAHHQCSTSSNPLLANMIRLWWSWIASSTDIMEVRGHQHQPWNEVADRLAKFALTHLTDEAPHPVLCPLHSLAGVGFDAHWSWMQSCPLSLLPAFPPLCDGQVLQFPPSLRRTGLTLSSPQQPVVTEPQSWTLSFNIVTVNVLALDSTDGLHEHGRRVGARTQRLDAQWHDQQLHLIGLQEARTAQGVFHAEHYKIWSSGHVGPGAARLGCELWCHLTLPLAVTSDGASLRLADFSVIVQHADPRRLFVRFHNDALSFSVVVLHTPCLSKTQGNGHRPIDDIEAWWTATQALCDRHLVNDMVWVLIDANAPLAADATPFFGLHGAETTNAQGVLFEAFLVDNHFTVPSSFEHLHSGPTHTWTHSSGKKMRRDYVLTSPMATPMSKSSYVLVDHDTAFDHEDHLPLCLQVCGTFLAPHFDSARIRWDDTKLTDDQAVAAFQQALRTLPLPTWDVNVDEHCRIYESNVLQLARQHFEATVKRRRRPQLSSSTLAWIAFKRHVLDCGRAWDLMQDETFKVELRALEKEVKARVHADLRIYYDQLLVRLQEAGDMHNLKAVHRALTRLGSKKAKQTSLVKPLPLLRHPDGTVATSFTEQQKIWMAQFSQIEAGTQIHWSELCRLDRPGLGPPQDVHAPDLFPSPWQLQGALKKLKRGKTPGLNALTPDVLKAGGPVLCQQLCALTTKIVAHCKEPLEWKGGLLIPLSKGKADASDPLGYRSIFISNFTAKLYHATLREYLVHVWEEGITSLQLGGRRRMGVDLAHHLIQAHGHWAAFRKLPSAHLFFDIKSAFYSVLRQALYPDDDVPVGLVAALHRFKVNVTDIEYMLQAVQDDDATAGVSDHFRLLLKDAMVNTHFFIRGLDAPCRTHRGTRPGDPLGDLLYNMVMALIMRDSRQTIQQQSEAAWIGQPDVCPDFLEPEAPPACAFLDLAFVDDCAVAIHCPSIDQVLHVVKVATHSMDVAARGRGLLLNYAPGKTEVLLNLIGRGSTHHKAQLNDAANLIQWHVGDSSYVLRVTHCYKHLGTWVQKGAKSMKEVSHRGTVARQSWGPLHRPFYSKRYVSMQTKMKAFSALTMSRLLYNVHIWSPCTPAMISKWQNALRKPLGLIAHGHSLGVSPLLLDVPTLCGLLRVLPPDDQLHVARLRYLKRLLSPFYSDHFGAPLTDAIRDWIPLIALDANWKGRLRTAAQSCRWFRQAQAEASTWQKRFNEEFQQAGGVLPDTSTPCQERWTCDHCNKWFASKRALARAHGYRRLVQYYAVGDVCHSCCRLYHNRTRLAAHLTEVQSCLDTLRACFPPVTDEMLADLDAQELETNAGLRKDGWGATKAIQPMRRVHGPRLPAPDSGDAQLLRRKYEARQGQGGHAFDLLQGRCAHPVRDEPEVVIFAADFPAFVLQMEHGFQIGHGLFDYAGLAKEYAILHTKSLLFVHFFSGFRRKGDLHFHLDHRVIEPGLELHVISADGPRAVRSAEFPFGCPALMPREWKQVLIGTRLLHFLLDILLLLARTGGMGFCEHPQFPTWIRSKEPASVWLHPAVRGLRLLRCVGITSFDQCAFGAPAVKPTTILHLRLPALRHIILRTGSWGRCCHGPHAHDQLQGREVDGSFRTSRCKVYPEQLNIALADAIARQARSVYSGLTFGNELHSDFLPFGHSDFVEEAEVQPDFYPHVQV